MPAKRKSKSARRTVKKTTTRRRTTLRSASGKKLYAVRDTEGKFRDIQSYKRAQGQDIQRQAQDEA